MSTNTTCTTNTSTQRVPSLAATHIPIGTNP